MRWIASGGLVAVLAFVLAACGVGEASAPATPAAPAAPTLTPMTYGVKSINLSWNAIAGATSYDLFEDADGEGPLEAAQIGGPLAGTTYSHTVSTLLHTRLNARYTVRACNAAGCSARSMAVGPNLTQAIGYFKASNTGAGDRFGNSVALSADGGTLAVAAHSEGSNATGINGNEADNSAIWAGAVYVFIRTGSTWSLQAYVKASNTGADDRFGASVALSSDGNMLAVGANGEASNATGINGNEADNSASDAGAVYVFTRTGST
jgi:hypothetical protein